MVVLGQWPFAHTITLEQTLRDTGIHMIYFVDQDRIVSYEYAKSMTDDSGISGYYLDEKYFTLMGAIIDVYIGTYREQIIPPPIHPSIKLKKSPFAKEISQVSDSAAILLVNNQSNELMEGIGAHWNHGLGFWIVDHAQLAILKSEKNQFEGKILTQKYLCNQIKVWGDVSKHIPLFRDIGGKQDEKDPSVWYIAISKFGKIQHLVSK